MASPYTERSMVVEDTVLLICHQHIAMHTKFLKMQFQNQTKNNNTLSLSMIPKTRLSNPLASALKGQHEQLPCQVQVLNQWKQSLRSLNPKP